MKGLAPPKPIDKDDVHREIAERNETQNQLSGGARRRRRTSKKRSMRKRKHMRRTCKHRRLPLRKRRYRCCSKKRKNIHRSRKYRKTRKQRGGSGGTKQLSENCASATGGSGDVSDPNGAGAVCKNISGTAAQANYGNQKNEFS